MRRTLVSRFVLGFLGLGAVASCGGRTRLFADTKVEVNEACLTNADCEGGDLCGVYACVLAHCTRVNEKTCPVPADSCFESACVPETGECEETPITEDADEDGHRAALPGFAPGAPGSCGDDCDDSRRNTFPGGAEICDGSDNDCDGIIDNGQFYLANVTGAVVTHPVPTSSFEAAGRRDIAFQGDGFAISFWGRESESRGYLRGLRSDASEVFPETPLTSVNAPTFGAALAFSGKVLAAAWSDARIDDNYEIYFGRFDKRGGKLGPDVRVTNAPQFSIQPDLHFEQNRFLLTYSDRRDLDNGSLLFARVISTEGTFESSEVQVSQFGENAEFPSLAASKDRLALVYTAFNGVDLEIRFRTYDKDFSYPSDYVLITSGAGRAPRILALGEKFLVTWETVVGSAPGPAIMGAVLDPDGNILVAPRPITFGEMFARYHSTLSLGDRAVLLWSADFVGNYDVYAKVIGSDLSEIEAPVQLSATTDDSLKPVAALSDDGHLGVVFDDELAGSSTVYFTSLGCAR